MFAKTEPNPVIDGIHGDAPSGHRATVTWNRMEILSKTVVLVVLDACPRVGFTCIDSYASDCQRGMAMGCEVVYADELQHVHTVCTKPFTMRFHPRGFQSLARHPHTIAAILIAIARMVDGYATQWRCPAGDDGPESLACVTQYPTRLPIAASLCPTEDSVGPWSCLDTISTSSDADIVGDVDCG